MTTTTTTTTTIVAVNKDNQVDIFSDYRHLENSQLEGHKLIMMVLKAAEDVIKKRGLQETAENYFKALWPLIFHHPTSMSDREVDCWLSAVLSLTAKIVPLVEIDPDRYSELFTGLSQLKLDALSAPGAKGSIVIAACVVHRFATAEDKSGSIVDLCRKILLPSCLDSRPKVRKQAHESVSSLAPLLLPPLIKEELVRLVLLQMQESTRRNCHDALHALPFIKRLFPFLEMQSMCIGEFMQGLDYCLGLGNSYLSIACFDVFEVLVLSFEHGSDLVHEAHRILLRHRPGPQLTELFIPWLASFIQTSRRQANLGIAVTSALEICVESQRIAEQQLAGACRNAVETLLSPPLPLSLGSEDMDRISCILNACLNVKMTSSWLPVMLETIRIVFTGLKTALLPHLSSTIQLLSILHDRKGFLQQSAVEDILKDICRFVGVGQLLSLIPLNLGTTQPKTWLISVIRQGCVNDSLSVFKYQLLPIAQNLMMMMKQANGECNPESLDYRVRQTISNQICSCLTGFLRYPLDFVAEFDDSLVELCVRWLADNEVLRPVVCNALSDLVDDCSSFIELHEEEEESRELPRGFDPTLARSILDSLGTRQASLLPALFTLALEGPSEHRSYVLRAIRSMLRCCPPDLAADYLAKLTSTLNALQNSDDDPSCHRSAGAALLDIASAIIQSSGCSMDTRPLQVLAMQGIQSPDGHIQKRSYRILLIMAGLSDDEGIADTTPSPFPSILASQELVSALAQTAVSCDPSARKIRFRVLCLMHWDPSLASTLIPAILPEVILGTREVNSRTRQAAFDLLIRWAREFQLAGTLANYVSMVQAGLAARTPSMMAATLMALGRIIFDLGKDPQISSGIVPVLLDDALLMVESPSKVLCKAALGFVKVSIVALDKTCIQERLSSLLSSILSTCSTPQERTLRTRVRHIVERLLRMFGAESVRDGFPSEHLPLLDHLQLMIRRRRTKQQQPRAFPDEPGTALQASQRVKKPFDEAMFDDLDDGDEEAYSDTRDDGDFDDELTGRLSLKSIKSQRSTKTAKTFRSAMSKKTARSADRMESPFAINKAGKIVICESEDDDDKMVAVDAVTGVAEDTWQGGAKGRRSSKRHMDDDDDDGLDDGDCCSPDDRGDKRSSVATGRTPQRHSKLPKGRSDRLRPGHLEPYAYVPLVRGKQQSGRQGRDSNYFMDSRKKRKQH